jgi:alkanesulfonate monooxygenase SsuD/methylene tetrahydromethanopterin reductase-like flavin-dependent oxidoreductase (luciferase family)
VAEITLDQITKGRVICSIGAGSVPAEYKAYDIPVIDDHDARVGYAREVVQLLKELWTHPAPEKACQQLSDLADPFAPTPRDAVCTEIYGGPAVAEVQGLYRGETIDARFARTDGCEIARWDRHAFLFPVEPGSP